MSSKAGPASLAELIAPEAVSVNLQASSKNEVLAELCALLKAAGLLGDTGPSLEAVAARERLGSTGCGSGVAVPHARLPGLPRPLVAVGVSRRGVDFGAVDGQPVRLFFLLLGPQDSPEAYLKVLSDVARLVREEEFRSALAACPDAASAVRLLQSGS